MQKKSLLNGVLVKLAARFQLAGKSLADKQLCEQEHAFHSLADNSPDVIVRYDRECRRIYINPAWEKANGMVAARVLGKTPIEMPSRIGAMSLDLQNKLLQTVETGSGFEFELTWIDQSGCNVWYSLKAVPEFDDTGAVLSVLTFARDITERKHTEDELRRISHIVEQTPASVVVTDTTGIIQYVNSKFISVTGYTRDEIYGQNPRILKSGDLSLENYKHMWETITSGNEWRGEFHNKTKDGEYYWESALISPIRDSKGTITHFVAIKEDITQRKRAEEEFKRSEVRRHELEQQLFQSKKLESLGTLASGIAHDFNNILAVIMGQASLLEQRRSDSAKFYRSLEGLQQSAERGASLVKQLLMIARKTEFVLQEVYIDDIAKEVIQLLSETFPKDIVISLNFKTVPPAIVGDANQLHQVILNLCVNARDAMPKGGSLTITTSIAQGELFTSNGSHPDGKEYVLIQVSDTGTGMDDATKERIFDLFFTTKDPGKGTGLGLSLVHSIVENHGGYIDVESSLNEGTTFNIYLPIPEYNITRVDVPGPAMEDVPGGNETILFIEDEMLLREYLRELLESKGYTVVTAINGEDGVAMFSHHRHEIDIVLSDFGLPKFSGDEVLKRITSLDAHAKIIFVSGYIDPDKKQELLNAGARRVIQKPYSTPLVLHTIREVLDEPGD